MGWKNCIPPPQYSVQSGTIANLYSVIEHAFVRPNMIWKNGVTYFVGSEDQAVSKQKIHVYKYVHATDTFSWQTVGAGSDVADTFNHNQAYLWNEGSNWYVGQSNPHNGAIDLWKCDVSDDVIGTWTELAQITGGNSYPHFYLDIDGKVAINIRTGTSAPNFNLTINKSNAGIEGTFTLQRITANSENTHRFYNQCPIYYGTNTIRYFISNRRKDSTGKYFGHALLKTTDNATFYNADETASKNVVPTNYLTNAEIDADYMINGTSGADTANLGFMTCICVDDVLYGWYIKSGTSDYYMYKLDGTTATETLIDIPGIYFNTANDHNMYLYYNGENIVISCRRLVDGQYTNELWATPMDLSSFSKRYVYDIPHNSVALLKLPENLDQITSEYAILTFAYLKVYLTRTIDKFYI